MKTKEKIIESGRELFNDQGVEKITTRHIAAAIGISQGNLHYHYPNKEEVIRALFEAFLEEVQGASGFDPNKPFEKQDVLDSMHRNFQLMYKYRFLFQSNEDVWRRVPAIKEMVQALFNQKKLEIRNLIMLYREQKIFRSDISDAQVAFLSEQFIFQITSWLTAARYSEHSADQVDYYVRSLFRLWLPYLNVAVMDEWESLLSE